jgi:hypothetical protein
MLALTALLESVIVLAVFRYPFSSRCRCFFERPFNSPRHLQTPVDPVFDF